MTNVEIANRVGISAPPCLRRIRNLEKEGYIDGYHARLNHKAFGYDVIVFANVRLGSHSDKDLEKFTEKAREWPVVRACYVTSGQSDFMLQVVLKTWDDYQDFLTQLTKVPNVQQVTSQIVVREVKNEFGVPELL